MDEYGYRLVSLYSSCLFGYQRRTEKTGGGVIILGHERGTMVDQASLGSGRLTRLLSRE
jgi:hypothetical protein